jgi:hypothetical protein
MRSGSVIALLAAAALIAPNAAGAAASREDRAFAHAFERYDGRARQIVADPALLAALRARQQASAGCVDAARALAQADRGGSGERDFEAQLFYVVYATDPFLEPLVRAGRDYGAALRRLHLRERTLRSARAVLLVLVDVRLPDQAALGDFCGPLRTWQAAGFAQDDEPAPIKAVAGLLGTQNLTAHRRATLRRAARRMRAVGMSRAARGDLALGGQGISLDPFLRGDQILAALQA